jgi:hypothetical protein
MLSKIGMIPGGDQPMNEINPSIAAGGGTIGISVVNSAANNSKVLGMSNIMSMVAGPSNQEAVSA